MTTWKPQPGKPAMTRAVKILVTDLVRLGADAVWSKQRQHSWTKRGFSFSGDDGFDLVEPTAAILEAYGIDADGKPVAKGPEAEPFDMAAHLQRQRDWSGKTFGPGPRTAGVIDHIRKELREIEADPTDISEWIDVVILALDGAWRAGYQPQQIIDALVAKQTKNEARNWPDWRTMSADKAIEHDRSGEVVAATKPAPFTPVDVAYISAIKLAEIMELAKRQPYGTPIAIEHDGFKGVVIGYYIRLDGVPGIVAQLDDARVVHVYGEKWLKPAAEVAKREGR